MRRLGDDMKESRLHNKPVNEDIAQLKTTELHLNSEIMKLKSDLRILTEINTRINKELTYCQSKLGITPSEKVLLKSEGDDIVTLPHQLHEFDFLIPLFTAYDHKVNALENALSKATEDILELEKKADTIVEDNNVLRLQLEKKSQTILEIYRGGRGEETLGASFYNLEKEDMNERMRLLNEENSTLLTNLKELNVNDKCLLKLTKN